jgi:hypothetical protein
MTKVFLLYTKVGKFLANLVSALVPDKQQRRRLRSRLDPLNPERCVAYLEKHYTNVPAIDESEETRQQDTFWVCWLQGTDSAPALVQNCIKSIETHCRQGWQVIVLTADNYADYVNMPSVMTDKWKRGIITNTHFSDLLRIYVLARHGGCWIDGTCLLTATVPADIVAQPFFLFHTHGEFSYTFIQSCFIRSKASHYIIRKWCAAMTAYWESENRLINYFTLHLMFVALLRRDEQFARLFASVPVMSDEPMHTLLYEMKRGGKYSESIMNAAREATFIQKLTYKFPADMLDDKESIASKFSQTPYRP